MLIGLTLLVKVTFEAQTDSLSAAKDFQNISGTQIYMFEKSYAFSYISIDSTVTDKLKATIYLYISTPLSSISNGVYTAIGFGTSQMSGSDILICSVDSTGICSCSDVKGVNQGVTSTTQVTNLVSSKVTTPLGAAWSPYVIQVTFDITRKMNPADVISGKSQAISAFGTLNSQKLPQQHNNGDNAAIKTGDGSKGAAATSSTSSSISKGRNLAYFLLAFLIVLV